MSIPYKIIIARMQPQKQLQLPYLMTRTLTSNLIINEESSLTPNSCGVLVVVGIDFHVYALSLPSGLDDVFDIAYSS